MNQTERERNAETTHEGDREYATRAELAELKRTVNELRTAQMRAPWTQAIGLTVGVAIGVGALAAVHAATNLL